MATKDKKTLEFTTLDGKRYRKTIDKKGNARYTVTDLKTKTNRFTDAKEFVKEGSRVRAQNRIKAIKEEADRKKREEEEAKANAILEAERKKREAEFQKQSEEKAKRASERKKKKREQETIEQARELQRFLNAVSDENDMVAQMTNKLLDHHDESLRVPYWRGLSKSFLRLSEDFVKLDKKFSEIYERVRKNKIVSEKDIKDFDALVTGSDPLFKKFESLIIDGANRKDAYLKKEDVKADKRRKDKRAERIEAVEKAKARRDKARRDKKRAERIEIVRKGREEQEKEFLKEKQRRLSQREKSDKFFSTGSENISKPSKVVLGGTKLMAGAAMAPFKALGFDFGDELDTLKTLFSPLAALGGAGLGLLKSGSEKLKGIDDKSLENFENIFTDPGLRKKKNIDYKKIKERINKTPGSKSSGIVSKASSILGALNPFKSNSSVKNIINNSNSNSSNSSFTQSTVSNRPKVFGGVQDKVIDFNRSDDKDGFKQLDKTNELLEDILKTLKGGTRSTTVKNRSGLPGFGRPGLVASAARSLSMFALPAMLGYGAAQTFQSGSKEGERQFSENQKGNPLTQVNTGFGGYLPVFNNSPKNKNNSGSSIKRSNSKNASKEDISNYNIFSQQSKNEIGNKNSTSSSIKNSNIRSDSSVTFRNTENNSATMRAETNKIEKLRDVKQDNVKIAEDMKKFLVGDFIEKLASAIAGKFLEKKNSTGTSLPPINPF